MDLDPTVLPCPFCGSAPEVRKSRNSDSAYCVTCVNFEVCPVRPMTPWFVPAGEKDGKAWAIAAWNKRA